MVPKETIHTEYTDKCTEGVSYLVYNNHVSTCLNSTDLKYDFVKCDANYTQYVTHVATHGIIITPCNGPDIGCFNATPLCDLSKCENWKLKLKGNHIACQKRHCVNFTDVYHVDYKQGHSVEIDGSYRLDCKITDLCARYENFSQRFHTYHCLTIVDWVIISTLAMIIIFIILLPCAYVLAKLTINKQTELSRENMRIKQHGGKTRIYQNSIAPNKTKTRSNTHTKISFLSLIFVLFVCSESNACSSIFEYSSIKAIKNDSHSYFSSALLDDIGSTACFSIKGKKYEMKLMESRIQCSDEVVYYIPMAEVDGEVEWRCPMVGDCSRTSGLFTSEKKPGEIRFSYASGWSGCLDIIHPECGRVFLKNKSNKYCKVMQCTNIEDFIKVRILSDGDTQDVEVMKTWTYVNSDISLKSGYHELSNSYNKYIQCDEKVYKMPVNEQNELNIFKIGSIQCPTALDASELTKNCIMDETSLFIHNEQQVIYHNPDLKLKTETPISTRRDFDFKRLYPEFATKEVKIHIKTETVVIIDEPEHPMISDISIVGTSLKDNGAEISYNCKGSGDMTLQCDDFRTILTCEKDRKKIITTFPLAYDGRRQCMADGKKIAVYMNTKEPVLTLSETTYDIVRNNHGYELSHDSITNFFSNLFSFAWLKTLIITCIAIIIFLKLLYCFFHFKE